jgi:hypothetical protein
MEVLASGAEGMRYGYDFGKAVTGEYKAPARFTGTIKQVVVDVSGALLRATQAEIMRGIIQAVRGKALSCSAQAPTMIAF